MPEAPPNRPGHVGHTPQEVEGLLRASRLAGLTSANVPRIAAERAATLASQTFPQPQRFRQRSLTSVLLSIDQLARRRGHVAERMPHPAEFREAVASTRAPE